MRKIKNPWIDKAGYNCFGCSPNNEAGVKMEFFEDGDDVVSFWKPDPSFQGWINTLHGGIQSLLFDEICAWTILRKMQTTGVTAKLDVRFMKPVMTTSQQLTLRAHIVDKKRNLVTVEAKLFDDKDMECAKATAIYYTSLQEEASQKMEFHGCECEGDELLPM